MTVMADEDSDRPQVLRAAIKLSKPSRWAAFGFGLAAMGAGGLAAFKAHLEAPPVALLAVGLILALIGLAGVLPTRLKVGDNEAEFLEERERVATALKQGVVAAPPRTLWQARSPEANGTEGDLRDWVKAALRATHAAQEGAREEIAEIVARVAKVAPQVAEQAQSAIRYASMTKDLADVIMAEPEVRTLDPDSEPRREILLIAYETDNRMTSATLANFYWPAFLRDDALNSALLLVTPLPLSASAERLGKSFTGLYHTVVRGPQDTGALRAAIRAALTGTPLRPPRPDIAPPVPLSHPSN